MLLKTRFCCQSDWGKRNGRLISDSTCCYMEPCACVCVWLQQCAFFMPRTELMDALLPWTSELWRPARRGRCVESNPQKQAWREEAAIEERHYVRISPSLLPQIFSFFIYQLLISSAFHFQAGYSPAKFNAVTPDPPHHPPPRYSSRCPPVELLISIADVSLLLSGHPEQPLHLIVLLLLSASLSLWWGSAGQLEGSPLARRAAVHVHAGEVCTEGNQVL